MKKGTMGFSYSYTNKVYISVFFLPAVVVVVVLVEVVDVTVVVADEQLQHFCPLRYI
jgi:hypothetical protein